MRLRGLIFITILASCSPQPKKAAPEKDAELGQTYLQTARETADPSYYTKAEKLFDRALAAKPDDVDALVGQASLAMSRHQFEKARAIAQHALDLNPYSAAAMGMLADAFVQLRDYDSAVRVLDRMVGLKPNLSSYSRISYMRELKGDTKGAIKAMQMAIQAGAPNGENTAWCIVQLGNLYLNSSHLSEAENAYHGALRRFPDYIHAYAGLAKVAAARKDFDRAVEYYRKAIDRVPMPEFLIGLSAVYQKMGKPAEASAQLQLVSNIKKVYEANGVSMDAEIERMMAQLK